MNNREIDDNEIYYENEVGGGEEFNLDLSRYFLMLYKRKWIILVIFLIVAVPWAYYIKKQPPIYETSCRIRFRNFASGTENVIDDSRIIELTSRSFAERVVAQLGLTLEMADESQIVRQQLFEGFVTTQSPQHGQYVFRWKQDGTYTIHRIVEENEDMVDSGSIIEAQSTLKETDYGFSFQLGAEITSLPPEVPFQVRKFRSAVESFQNSTNVRITGGGGILLLTMTDKNPVLVAKKVNRLAELFVNESKLLKKTMIEKRKSTISEQLMVADQELAQTDQALKNFREGHKVSLGEDTKTTVQELNQTERDLEARTKQRKDLNELLLRLDNYQYDPNGKENLKYVYEQITELETFNMNPKMGILEKQLKDLQISYNRIVTQFSESHDEAIEFQGQIEEVQNQIKIEAKAHLTDLDTNIAQLQREKSALEYRLSRLPDEQYKLTELERQLKAKEQIRSELLTKMQLAQISDAVETERIDILDPALIPDEPTNRDKKKKAMMGGVFGFVLGIGVAFLLEFLDKAIKSVDDVKRYLKLQVLGTIPNIDFKDLSDYQDTEKIKQIDQQLVTYDYSPTPIGEAYRSLRTNLVYSKTTGRIQSLVITSAAPGDGKSFTSANIAISMAQHKSNTLLIDADLRRGVLHNTFGVSKEPGLTNYLTGMIGFQHIINETLIPNLSLVSCGSLLPNPSELLGSHQMQRFLDEARRKFDIIIFDSPPLNAATDAVVIGTQVEALVLVVRSGVTNRDVAKTKLELFKNVPVRILGAILNGTSADFGHDGYSYYHY